MESRTCKSNGKWEPELPICKRKDLNTGLGVQRNYLTTILHSDKLGSGCEKLVSPHYGVVIYSSATIGSYAKYFCKDGYYLVGIRFRKCEETGWTGEAPICKCKELYCYNKFEVTSLSVAVAV